MGAGCAGLSLAAHLERVGLQGRRILLLDARERYVNDRTWCYFDVEPHLFSDAVTHRWMRWAVADPHQEVVRECRTHPYTHVSSQHFYDRAFKVLGRTSGVEVMLGVRVEAIEDRGTAVALHTSHGVFHANLAFDSRPVPRGRPKTPGRHVEWWQHFVGWTVETDRSCFDPSTVQLMDFRVSQEHGVHFTYVLPFSDRTALVEDTFFSAAPIAHDLYHANLRRFLNRRGCRRWTTVHREQGRIPMNTAPIDLQPSPRVYRIGLTGGLARPATGYAFLAMQRHARRLAAALQKNALPRAPRVRPRRTTFLDRVFLQCLASAPQQAPALFVQLFRTAPPTALARFLAEASTPRDELAVIRGLPPGPLTRALWTSFRPGYPPRRKQATPSPQ